jgi:hypothetical protein
LHSAATKARRRLDEGSTGWRGMSLAPPDDMPIFASPYFHSLLLLLLPSIPVVTACSDNGDLDPGAGNAPGEGSFTLFVDANVEARPLVPNAAKRVDFTTSFQVRLARGDTPVTTGEVLIESSAGLVALTYSTEDNRWTGLQNGYAEVYRLSATAGADTIDGVRVDGPSLHWFTAPTAGATVDTRAPVTVTWSRGDEAETARLDTDQLDELAIPDSGSYSIAAGGFKSKRDDVEQERIRLTRSRRVTPSGALAGSEMQVTVRNEIAVVVAPTL